MSSEHTEDTAGIDIGALTALLGDDDPGMLNEILSLYALEARKTYDKVAASAGAFSRLAAAAHAAKGEARAAGAVKLANMYAELEMKAKNNETDTASLVAGIGDEVGRVEHFIATFTSRTPQRAT